MSTITAGRDVRFVPDVQITAPGGEGGGFAPSLYLVKATTEAGREWISENVDQTEALWFGSSLVVEHRYIAGLFDGMVDAGLVVR